jgi:photosystem II stability/assembly factor-like uncharacterized protein
MVTASQGWALAALGPGFAEFGGPVVRTVDGGAHWTTVLHPGAGAIPFDFGPIAADFHDATHAWVVGFLGAHSTASFESVIVASTSNAGITWSSSPLGVNGQAVHIQFVDASHGWVFATPSAGGVIGAGDTTLYRTIDAGGHWQAIKPASQVRQNPDVSGTLPEACPDGGPISAPSFIDASNGWLGAFCDRAFFYATHDGGLSWTAQGLPAFPGPASPVPSPLLYSVDGPLFTSPRDGVAFVKRGFTTGANALQDAAAYVTHDAGASWAAFRLPVSELTADFVDPQHGWIVSAGSGGNMEVRSLYATVDGGATWRFVSGPQDYFDRELSFVNTATGFIGAPATKNQPGQFLTTSDRGATWVPISTSIDG